MQKATEIGIVVVAAMLVVGAPRAYLLMTYGVLMILFSVRWATGQPH